jgi:hypothetical protein
MLAVLLTLLAQPADLVGPVQPKILTPAEAQTLALADLQRLPAGLQETARYVWIQNDPSVERVKSVTATLNRISRASMPFRPVVLAENRLVRFDLSQLTFDVDAELAEMAGVWESLRFDPAFNLLLTPDALKIVLSVPEAQQPQAMLRDGKEFRTARLSSLAVQDVVRIPAQHCDLKVALGLFVGAQTAAPVVEADYFEFRALSSIRDKGPYATIWGGLYYDFRGIRKSKAKGKSDLDLYLEQLGATGKRLAEQRIGMFRSNVTGKPRAVEFLPATNRRVGDGPSAVSITSDVKDQSIDLTQHAMLVLQKTSLRPDAHEVIAIGANGFNEYSLFNGQGERQDEVPPDVAADSTIPNPFPKRLQAAISCIRCHEAAGDDGWKPAKNDVTTLAQKGFPGVLLNQTASARELQKLIADYRGEPSKFLTVARNSLQAATLEATAAWDKGPLTGVVKSAGKRVEADYARYWYAPVDAESALKSLGRKVPADKAVATLAELMAPAPELAAFGLEQTDTRIAALTHGLAVNRIDFELVRAFMQFRAQQKGK